MNVRGHIVLFLSAFSTPLVSQSKTDANIRVDPHYYLGTRGSEPVNQLNIYGDLNWSNLKTRYPWQIELHGDFETLGRKDNSVDLDRVWIEVPFGKEGSPSVVIGRIHPFDLSQTFEANRPWGYLAESHPQNRGINLGHPFSEDVFPNPILQGWIGAHFWSDTSHANSFQWGLSASPVFIPSMGSQVTYSGPVESRAGRFGRQAPGYVEIKGQRYPISYEVDTSEISSQIFQPQLMAQVYGRVEGSLRWESWLALRRAPSVEPELIAKGRLDLRESSPSAFASVRPIFSQQWSLSLSQKLTSSKFPKHSSLFASAEVEESGRFGGEIGFEFYRISLSYLNEYRPKKNTEYTLDNAPYSQHLIQLQAQFPTAWATFYGGAKWHFTTSGAWVRGGVRSALTKVLSIDLGADIFVGGRETYFGEWRTNDRLSLGIVWRFG